MKDDWADIVKGIEELGAVIKELPNDMQDCETIWPDLDRIEEWAWVFSSPEELMKALLSNLLVNYGQVEKDITKT